MKNLRNFILLALAAAVAVYGTVALRPSPKTVPQSGELVFPGLLENLNDTASIDGASGGETYKLAVSDGQWVLPDKDGYRADSQSVRQLLLGVASLERVEPKTSNPALYEKLGLVDPSDAGSDARAFTVSDGSGAKLAELIVGDSKPSRGDPQLTEFYVRFPGDDQSWLVQGKLPSAQGAPDWIDKTIIDIPAVRVRSVSVTHLDGETVTVSKVDAADQTFTLEDVPEGTEVKDAYRLNDIGRGLAKLDLEDVKRGPGEGETEPAYTVTMRTFDGLVVELDAVKSGDATLATFTARVEEVEAAAVDEAASQSGSDTASASDTKSEQAESAAEGDKPDSQAVEAEAETLNARWDGWLYTLPGYKAEHFARKRAELVGKPDVKEALDSLQNPSPSSSPAPAPAESDAQSTDSSGESSSSN